MLALALLGYAAALSLHGNGFVAAFCGVWHSVPARADAGPPRLVFLEQVGSMVSLLVWLAFGAVAIPIMVAQLDATMVLYAVLSLTLVRMIPVAVATIGAGFDRDTVLFVGWFGPRGLASSCLPCWLSRRAGSAADEALSVIAVTVFLSVLAHGLSAAPLATRYGRSAAAAGDQSPAAQCRWHPRGASPSDAVGARERSAETPSGTVTRPSTPGAGSTRLS